MGRVRSACLEGVTALLSHAPRVDFFLAAALPFVPLSSASTSASSSPPSQASRLEYNVRTPKKKNNAVAAWCVSCGEICHTQGVRASHNSFPTSSGEQTAAQCAVSRSHTTQRTHQRRRCPAHRRRQCGHHPQRAQRAGENLRGALRQRDQKVLPMRRCAPSAVGCAWP